MQISSWLEMHYIISSEFNENVQLSSFHFFNKITIIAYLSTLIQIVDFKLGSAISSVYSYYLLPFQYFQ